MVEAELEQNALSANGAHSAQVVVAEGLLAQVNWGGCTNLRCRISGWLVSLMRGMEGYMSGCCYPCWVRALWQALTHVTVVFNTSPHRETGCCSMTGLHCHMQCLFSQLSRTVLHGQMQYKRT